MGKLCDICAVLMFVTWVKVFHIMNVIYVSWMMAGCWLRAAVLYIDVIFCMVIYSSEQHSALYYQLVSKLWGRTEAWKSVNCCIHTCINL